MYVIKEDGVVTDEPTAVWSTNNELFTVDNGTVTVDGTVEVGTVAVITAEINGTTLTANLTVN